MMDKAEENIETELQKSFDYLEANIHELYNSK